MKQINFLREQYREQEAFLESDRKLAKKAAIGLVVFLGVFLAVVGVSFYVERQIQALDESILNLDNRLQSMVPFEREYAVYVAKIKAMREISEARRIKTNAASYFYTLIPQEFVLKDVVVDDAKSQITFSVVAKDVFSATKVIGILRSADVAKRNYSIDLSEMNRDEAGAYRLAGAFHYGVN